MLMFGIGMPELLLILALALIVLGPEKLPSSRAPSAKEWPNFAGLPTSLKMSSARWSTR